MEIYAAKVCEVSDGLCERLCPLLDKSRAEKVAAMKHHKERLRSLFAGLLLRYAFLAQGYSEQQWKEASIAKGCHGKPYLVDFKGFSYSLSHSGEWVLCAVDDKEIGADIQEAGTPKLAVAKRFYAGEEYQRLLQYASDLDRQTAELYRIWTAKESCVKLTGRGIGAGISRYVTDSTYMHIKDIVENSLFFIRLYEGIPGYMICVCSRCECFPKHIIITDLANTVFNMGGEGIC